MLTKDRIRIKLPIPLLVETANKLHELLPGSKLTVFENCGHFSYQDKSDEFAAMVENWVEQGG